MSTQLPKSGWIMSFAHSNWGDKSQGLRFLPTTPNHPPAHAYNTLENPPRTKLHQSQCQSSASKVCDQVICLVGGKCINDAGMRADLLRRIHLLRKNTILDNCGAKSGIGYGYLRTGVGKEHLVVHMRPVYRPDIGENQPGVE